jgi:O-antigen/teichoic acid export membrane protein
MTATDSGGAIGKDAAVGAVWQMLGFACITVCGYVVAVLLARSFGPAAFGVFGVVYSVLMTSELILRLGVPQALVKLIGGSRAGSSQLQATGVTLTMIINLAGFAVIWVTAPLLADALNVPNGDRLFRIAVLDRPFFALYTCLAHVLNGRGEFRITGIVSGTYGLTKVIGVVIMAATDTISIEGALIVNIAASVVALAFLLPRSGMAAYRPRLTEKGVIIALAVPITIGDFGLQSLLGIDLWLLNALGASVPADVKGHYVAALSLARLPNIVTYVLAAVLVPSIARALGSGDRAAAGRLVLGATRFLAVLVLPVCVLIATNAGELMALMFSEDFRSGARYLALLIFAQGLGYTFLGALYAILIGTGDAAIGAKRIYGGLAVGMALNLILIPLFGATGAAVAALASFATATLLIARVVWRKTGVLLDARRALLALFASLAVGIIGWLVPATGPMVLVELAGLGLAYLGAIWAMGLIQAEDFALLRGRRPDQTSSEGG